MQYIGYLHKEADSDFGVSFPDFPGCITAGESLEDARDMAEEALGLHILGLVEDVLITPDMPERTVRFNITARQNQLEAIDRLARKAGMNRSAFLVHSALATTL